MGSGPMRAAVGTESLLEKLQIRETTSCAVGVLETSQLPPPHVTAWIAQECGVPPSELCLLVARTASQAGTMQVVARSIETALHKLFDLGFDLRRVVSGFGTAPLPPVAADDLIAIGRTNDAILYGARVTLWVRGDDDSLAAIVRQVPSSASRDFGSPFRDVFARANYDFYQIDPHLFSPAAIRLVNLDSGRTFEAGRAHPDVLRASFECGGST
jgi:methenyltetrahydromethanopterin cyclohydrolase